MNRSQGNPKKMTRRKENNMGRNTARLAGVIKNGVQGSGDGLYAGEYVASGYVKIGGAVYTNNVHINPECTRSCAECGKEAVKTGDTVIVAKIGTAFYIICKVA